MNVGNPLRPTQNPLGFARDILREIAQAWVPAIVPVMEMRPTGEVIIQGLAPATLTTTGAQQVQWPCDGYLVGITATTRSGVAADWAGTLLRVVIDGNTELFTTGSAAYYKPFIQLNGGGDLATSCLWKTRITFRQGTSWQAYVNNTTAATVTCDIAFAYVNTSQPRI